MPTETRNPERADHDTGPRRRVGDPHAVRATRELRTVSTGTAGTQSTRPLFRVSSAGKSTGSVASLAPTGLVLSTPRPAVSGRSRDVQPRRGMCG